MPDVRIRGLEENVVHLLKAQAKRKGRSLQADLKELLEVSAYARRRQLVDDLKHYHEEFRAKYGEMPDSTPLIREERDRIG
jgi:plasmid stability protein